MHAKPVLIASMVCAALLAAGCGERAPGDARARNDTASPPVISPSPSASPSTSADATPAGKVAEAVSDTALTAKVKTALVAEPGIKATAIEVTTKDAVVTLSGSVDSTVEKAKAVTLAQNVQGVKNVVDHLSLKS